MKVQTNSRISSFGLSHEAQGVIDAIPDPVYTKDVEGRIVAVNARFEALYGVRKMDIVGRTPAECDIADAQVEADDAHVALGSVGGGESEYWDQSGCQLYLVHRKVPYKDLAGDRPLALCIVSDVTAQRETARHLKMIATTDALTSVQNRLSLMKSGEEEFQRFMRYSRQFSVLAMDVDRFKSVNDTYGHAAGDAVLRHVAATIKDCLRASDLLGRIGGEEFAVILPETSLAEAESVAQRVLKSVRQATVQFENHVLKVTVSIGVETVVADDSGFDRVLLRADRLLYRAKSEGRDRVICPTT
jgi:diguanylate cyclase (GGDEF)-like protein/PAS domain S-box-containing protein